MIGVDRLPRVYWYLVGATLIDRIGGFIGPFLSIYLSLERGYSIEQAGFVAACGGAGAVAAGPIGGALSDRFGRRPVLVGGPALTALATLHLMIARSPAHIALAAALWGFCANVQRPAAGAAIADVVPPALRQRAYALWHWAVNIGFAVATSLAGLLAARGFTMLFVLDAATTTACACAMFALVPETRPPGEARGSSTGGLVAPLRDAPFLVFVAGALLLALCFHQAGVTMPLDLQQRGMSTSTWGMVFALNGVLIAFLQPFTSGFVARRRPTSVLAFGAVCVGVGFGMTALGATPSIVAASIVVWTIGELVTTPVNAAVVASLSPPDRRGAYQGTLQLAWALSSMAAPLVGAWVLASRGPMTLWGGCLLLGLAAAVLYVALGPALARRTTT